MLPSPSELTHFSEVATCLNLTRAAERLGVTQPSLSLSIKKLERVLDTSLFIRHKHGVSLTPAGEQLLSQVQPLLDHWERAKELTKTSHQEVVGRIKIGCRSAAAHQMSDFLKNLLTKHPKIEVNFEFQDSISATEGVINSTLDIGIVNNPIPHPDLIVHKITDTDLGFWVNHTASDIQDIHSGKAVIICEPNSLQVRKLLRELEKMNIKIGRVVTANSLEVIAQFTLAGCGIGILSSCMVDLLYADKLKRVPELPNFRNEACIIYRYENKSVKTIMTVLDALKAFTQNFAK